MLRKNPLDAGTEVRDMASAWSVRFWPPRSSGLTTMAGRWRSVEADGRTYREGRRHAGPGDNAGRTGRLSPVALPPLRSRRGGGARRERSGADGRRTDAGVDAPFNVPLRSERYDQAWAAHVTHAA